MDTGQAAMMTPLVLLPGTLCDGRVFAPLVAQLHGHACEVLPMTGAETAAGLAEAILAAAPARFVLVGFSLGGIVALEIAATSPERVAGLVLIASTARASPAGSAQQRRADVVRARAIGMAEFVLERLWPRYVAAGALGDGHLRGLVVDMAESLGADALHSQTEVAIERSDSRMRLRSLPMPVLAICGAEDVVCPPELHREIQAAARDATLCVVPDAGHLVLLEAPAIVAGCLLSWLGRISQPAFMPTPSPADHTQELT